MEIVHLILIGLRRYEEYVVMLYLLYYAPHGAEFIIYWLTMWLTAHIILIFRVH